MKRKKKKNPDLITIGAAAKKLGIHEQTIRTYEREGLIKPHRSAKNTRFFSKQDMTRIITIVTLTQEFGLNRAGVNLLFSFAKKCRIKDEELLDFIEDQKKITTQAQSAPNISS